MNIIKNLRRAVLPLFATAVAVLATAAFSACSSEPAEILPDDIVGLVRVDVKSIADKAALDERPEVKDLKEKFLEEVEDDLSKASYDRLKEMLDDPSEFGIDLRAPVYFYGPGKSFPYAGMAASVHSQSKLHDFMELIVKESEDSYNAPRLKEYDGLEVLVDEREKMAIAYDGDHALLVLNVDRKESFLRDIRKRFENKSEGSIADTEAFKKMKSEGGDVSACLFGSSAVEMLNDYMPSEVKEMYKKYHVKDYAVIAGLTFADESIDLYTETIVASDEAKKQLEDATGALKAVSGKHLASIPADAFAVAGAGLDGAKYWDLIKKAGGLDIMQKEGFPEELLSVFENAVKAVSGEATIAIAAPAEGSDEPDVYAFVDVKSKADADKAVNPIVSAYNEQMNSYNEENCEYYWYTPKPLIEDAGDGTFLLPTGVATDYNPEPTVLAFGTQGNTFFISTDADVRPGKNVAESLAKAPYAERIKESLGYAVVNIAALMANKDVRRSAERKHISDFLDHLATAEIYAKSATRAEGHVFFRELEKDQTPLSYICDIISDMCSRYM